MPNAIVNAVKNWFQKDAEHYLYVPLPADKTPAETHYYCRFWLSEMFLKDQQRWFRKLYPAVQTAVTFSLSDEHTSATFSRVARPDKDVLAPGVLLNYPLTPILPFEDGTIGLEAHLLELRGESGLLAGLKVLEDVSGLLIEVPLAQAVSMAGTLAQSLDGLFHQTGGEVHLALHQTFTHGAAGVNPLVPGYLAVVLATAAQLDKSRLSVIDGRLSYRENSGKAVPLQGYDYMLFHVEGFAERKWKTLTQISPLYDKTQKALFMGQIESAAAYEGALIEAVFDSKDLVKHDKLRIAKAIREEFAPLKAAAGHGAVGAAMRPLDQVLTERALSIEAARELGPVSLEAFLAAT